MDDVLREELLARTERDQAARSAELADDMVSVDAENLVWLRESVRERGWPGRSEVGENGALALWLLAQHVDRVLLAEGLPQEYGIQVVHAEPASR
jgi:hypothetical protein